ncbi:MAG: hypothetical protein KDI55_06290 [Anaerolineae bacterium]|nr:hypothetical protein [Anaerolineae bacterium]
MIQRPSQNPAYWTTEFELLPDDIDFLQIYLSEPDRPVIESDMVEAFVVERIRREDQHIRKEVARGKIYDPREKFAIGDDLVFTALDFALATVVGERPGRNPEHGEFTVLAVAFEDGNRREFAAELTTPHKLNHKEDDEALIQSDAPDPAYIIEVYGRELQRNLTDEMLALDDTPFVNQGRYWSLNDLLADVHVGHLNIAEAAIDLRGAPLPTIAILPELDLPREIPPALAGFSVDIAMADDRRFVDVGTEGREWYLRRLLPEAVISTPRRLQYVPVTYDRSLLNVRYLQLEWELDDEWSEGAAETASSNWLPRVDLTLTYPHRRSGTLPLTSRTSTFFPVRPGKRSMITFVDGRWGKRFTGWVVPDGLYVAGLWDWYEEHSIPVGGIVVLERTEDPLEVVVDVKPHRSKREWVRMARVENDQLRYQLQKQLVSCDYDELMFVAEADPAATDEFRRSTYDEAPSVFDLVDETAPQLMGLSTRGVVHVKTVYSAINLVRRTPPGPVFAAVVSNPRFQEVGDGEFGMAR